MLQARLELSERVTGFLSPTTPDLTGHADIANRLATSAAAPNLLHLDVRRPNPLCRSGRLAALIARSNLSVSDPRLGLTHMTEYGSIQITEP